MRLAVRSVLAAAALAALGAPGAARAATTPPRACAVVADPAGDVVTFGPAGAHRVADGHVDLLAVSVAHAPGALHVTFRGTAMSPWRLGAWQLAFNARGRRYYARASLGQWNSYGARNPYQGFWAGYAGIDKDVKVPGAWDFTASTATVRVPLAALGRAALRPGDRLTSFAVAVREELLYAAPDGRPPAAAEAGLTDTGGSSASLVVAGECRPAR